MQLLLQISSQAFAIIKIRKKKYKIGENREKMWTFKNRDLFTFTLTYFFTDTVTIARKKSDTTVKSGADYQITTSG